MTSFDLSRNPRPGQQAPQWGRGGRDNLGPGNFRGPSGPPDNRPPSGSRPHRAGCLSAIASAVAPVLVVLIVAGVAAGHFFGWLS